MLLGTLMALYDQGKPPFASEERLGIDPCSVTCISLRNRFLTSQNSLSNKELTGISIQGKFFVSKMVFFYSSTFLPLSVTISFSLRNAGVEGNVPYLPGCEESPTSF